jgi:DUF177 domain-containing protein
VATVTDQLDLGRLALSAGEGRRLDVDTRVGSLTLGGQRYSPRASVPVRIDVSRTTSGYSLRLRASIPLEGPCMRCLEAAGREVAIDAREVDQPGGGEDLTSPYLDGDELDVRAWTRDALALALPAQLLCAEECLGLCGTCGENLNTAAPGHSHEVAPDPRWAVLRELRFD